MKQGQHEHIYIKYINILQVLTEQYIQAKHSSSIHERYTTSNGHRWGKRKTKRKIGSNVQIVDAIGIQRKERERKQDPKSKPQATRDVKHRL